MRCEDGFLYKKQSGLNSTTIGYFQWPGLPLTRLAYNKVTDKYNYVTTNHDVDSIWHIKMKIRRAFLWTSRGTYNQKEKKNRKSPNHNTQY